MLFSENVTRKKRQIQEGDDQGGPGGIEMKLR